MTTKMKTKTVTPDEVAVPKRPVAPSNVTCARCGALSPDVLDGDSLYCSIGCIELTRRGL
jgi:hypothetical protein